MQEHAPKTEFKSHKRLRPEMLIPQEKSEYLPENFSKRLLKIVKALQPFEDLYIAAQGNALEQRTLADLMEMEGTLSQEFVEKIEGLGKMVAKFRREKEMKIVTKSHDEKIWGKYKKFSEAMDIHVNKILKNLFNDQRPLATNTLFETQTYGLLLALTNRAYREGMDYILSEIEKRSFIIPERQEGIINTVAGASFFKSHEQKIKYPYTTQEIFNLIKNGCYLPMHTPYTFTLPDVLLEKSSIYGDLMITSEYQHAFLGSVRFFNPHKQEPVCLMHISRITGELIPGGMTLMSARTTFESLSNKETYERLQHAALFAFLQAISAGAIEEIPYIIFTPEERKQEKDTNIDVGAKENQILKKIQEQSTVNYQPSTINPLITQPLQSSSLENQIAEINAQYTKEKSEQRNTPFLESRITWRRVIAALQRLGVSIEFDGAHPKLKYKKLTSRYLNPHERDPQRCKEELYRVLKEFSIPRQQFFAVLK